MAGPDSLLEDFMRDREDLFDSVEETALHLERNPTDQGSQQVLFRSVHTLKGNCGFLGFGQVEQLLQQTETLLELVRDGEVRYSTGIADLLLAVTDRTRQFFDVLEATNQRISFDTSDLLDRLADACPEGSI